MKKNKKQIRLLSFEDEDEKEEPIVVIPKKNSSTHEFKKVNKTKSGFAVSTKKKHDNFKTTKRYYSDDNLDNLKRTVEDLYNGVEEGKTDFEEVIKKKTFKNENDEIETTEYIERVPKNQISDEKNSTKILDEFSIQNAKMKRLKAQNEENFIPLEKNEDKEDNSTQSSDEDEDEIFEEHKGKKIKFGMTTEKRNITHEVVSSEESNSDSDEKEWEELQLQNAGFNVLKRKKEKKLEKIKQKDVQIAHIDSFEKVQKELNDTLKLINEANEKDEKEFKYYETTYKENEGSLDKIIEDFDSLNQQYIFYQKMRSYIEDLIDCIDKKVPEIEDCENDLLRLRKEFSQEKRDKWVQYQKDKLDISNDDEKNQRIASFESSKIIQSTPEMEEIFQDAKDIFSDTIEDYSSISKIKQSFNEWKTKFEKSFNDTYCNLSLQKVYAPFIRLEMISWDPLENNNSFVDFSWFKQLQSEDEILPNLILKILIPRLSHSIQNCYDVFSSAETKNLVSLMNDVSMFIDIPEEISIYLVERFSIFIDELILPNLKFDWKLEFFKIQIEKSFQLLNNLFKWKGKINFTDVQNLILKFINQHLKHYFEIDNHLKNEFKNKLPKEYKHLIN
eukprot:gene8308-132_t